MSAHKGNSLLTAATIILLSGSAQAQVAPNWLSALAQIETQRLPLLLAQSTDEQQQFIMQVQQHLQTLGLYDGAIDGIAGPGTWNAIRRFTSSAGLGEAEGFGEAEFALLGRAAEFAQNGATVTEAIRRAADPGLDEAAASFQAGLQAYQSGDYAQAEAFWRETLAASERILGPDHPDTLSTRNNLANAIDEQGRAAEAEVLNRETLAARERILGPDHPHTLGTRINLAVTVEAQGRTAEAEVLYRETLAARERVLGPDHPDTLGTRNNLAIAIEAQGRAAEAEVLWREILDARERVLGLDHPDTLATRNNLANAIEAQGRAAEAEVLHRETLAARERVLGPDHPDTLNTRTNLAAAILAQGRAAEAEVLWRETLAASERVQGPDHPNTLITRNNLAGAIEAQGRAAEAEIIWREALAALERVRGPDHPNTLSTRNNLANAIDEQGRAAEAEVLYRETLAACERVLGPDHPDTLATRNNLANAIDEQGRAAEAEVLHRETLAARERVLGPDHPDTLNTRNNLAVAIEAQGRAAEAEVLHRETLAARERVLGPDHPDTLASRYNLANAVEAQGRAAEAEVLYRETLAASERILGPDHPHTLDTRNNLAVTVEAQGRTAEAEVLYRETLAARERVLGPDHPDTLNTRTNLAAAILAQGRAAEAEVLWRETLAASERVLGPDHPDTLGTRNNLAAAIEAQGRAAEAEVLHRETLAGLERVLGTDHSNTLGTRHNLAIAIQEQGRAAEAEVLYREILAARERVLGLDHPDTLATRNNLANAIRAQGRLAEAEVLWRETLASSERVLGPDHPDTLNTRNNLATAIQEQGRAAEAEVLHREILASSERVLGPDHPDTLRTGNNLALALDAQGRAAEAEVLHRETLAARERVLGPDHPDTLGTRYNLAINLRNQGQPEAALSVVEDAFPYLPSALSVAETTPLNLTAYLAWAWESFPEAASARTFPAQGYLTYGSLDLALGDQSARREVADPAAAAVLRAFQEARDELQRLRRAFLVSFDASFEVTEQARARIQSEMRAADERFQEVSARMERDFPALADLELPRALNAEEAQALLKPGEGLLAFAAMEDHLYAWLVTHDNIEWHQADVSRAELDERADFLRRSLDNGLSSPPQLLAVSAECALPLRNLETRTFDLCAAQDLHDLVLGGIDLTGIDELIVVPDGPLETLPFILLVTDRDPDGAPRWLIEGHAITTLPTTSSLRALRQHDAVETANDDRLPFLGLAPVDFPPTEGRARRGIEILSLPATHREVKTLAALLDAGEASSVIGASASETFVYSAPLDQYRILSFATHGWLANQTAELSDDQIREMSLMLRHGDGEDGFLTSSEVATLRLNADWVLLSACNTAGEGDGADGLSGLARAFFFAGARSLMVTHWDLNDEAGAQLMEDTIEAWTVGRADGRAEALRQAQLTMLQRPGFRHPHFWAPFSVVGENR